MGSGCGYQGHGAMSTVAEKYTRAVGSSKLQMRHTDLEQGAIDTVAAAGCSDSLGVGLLRLRAEYDTIRTMPGARTMMPRLKSAASVRTRMLALVIDRGGPEGQDAIDLVAKLLDAWCDPSCHTCTGRGAVGGYGSPQHICPTCGGSKRRSVFWETWQQGFADTIEGVMLAKVDSAERKIRRLLRD